MLFSHFKYVAADMAEPDILDGPRSSFGGQVQPIRCLFEGPRCVMRKLETGRSLDETSGKKGGEIVPRVTGVPKAGKRVAEK